ncbi:carbon-nitrogen hydrolase family protein [bacterium]|nr:carbon-nitrogen hydrolase family protein [bacterium]
MRIGLVQICSTDNLQRNIDKAEGFIREAAKAGAQLVALPESFLYRGSPQNLQDISLKLKPTTLRFSRLAKELGIRLLLGTVPEPTGDRGKLYNTSIFYMPSGEGPVRYKKLHLFSVAFEDGKSIDESRTFRGGNRVWTHRDGEAVYGFTICYDLRFPELFRLHAQAGANVMFVPSNFTKPTGEAHWHLLLRARAVENLSYVVAPAQCGFDPGNRIETYGHSLVVSPWGEVLLDMGEAEGIGYATLDFQILAECRKRLPALGHMRSDVIKLEVKDRRAELIAAQEREGR